MDWQHLIMNGESLAEYAALLASTGLLGHQHANSGWGTFDDDNMVGATAFMETLELALEFRRAGLRRRTASGSASTCTRTRRTRSRRCSARCCSGASSTASPRRSTTPRCARRSPRKDAVRAYELVYAALGGLSLVGLDVGTTGVKAIGSPRPARCSPAPRRSTRSRSRSPAGRSRIPRTGGARPSGRSARSADEDRSGSPGRCTGSSCSTRTTGAAAGDPLERPAHRRRVRGDRGARRLRAARRADRQPRADRASRRRSSSGCGSTSPRSGRRPRTCCCRRTTSGCG